MIPSTFKFRGRRSDNLEWIYGDLTYHRQFSEEKPYIKHKRRYKMEWFEVYPKTIGMMVPHKDASGKEIYAGDCYRTQDGDDGSEMVWVIAWVHEYAMFAAMPVADYVMYSDGQDVDSVFREYPYPLTAEDCKRITICQNIYEKPELLKQ